MDGSWGAVLTDDRTSSETFCDGGCEEDPIIHHLTKKVEDMVGIREFFLSRFEILIASCAFGLNTLLFFVCSF